MFSKIKTSLTSVLAVGITLLYAILQREKRKTAYKELKRSEAVNEYRQNNAETLVNGLKTEDNIRHEKLTDNGDAKRDHFS